MTYNTKVSQYAVSKLFKESELPISNADSQGPQIPPPTHDRAYFERLEKSQNAWWRRILNVQAPYGWNLRRLKPGFMLDVGCGLGRHLLNVGGQGVGIDPNRNAVDHCRKQGLTVFTPEEFAISRYNVPGTFDAVLLSHVAEHIGRDALKDLLVKYVPALLKKGGRLILITPQEVGFRKDPTHVEYFDFLKIGDCVAEVGFYPVQEYSFPLPRAFGRLAYFNEFVSVSIQKPL